MNGVMDGGGYKLTLKFSCNTLDQDVNYITSINYCDQYLVINIAF